ncbi:MAG: hypothetical protein K5905_17055 [Roseibium sp.]|uniref:hypothetical protein n=1 Tax=Roseibium sp. TaxID=1936156 RepID=UPI002611380A|nr:hypothetical protein [Roseibium sp.]MCV0427172.1 hypothetical protein [Roseibium sp.]
MTTYQTKAQTFAFERGGEAYRAGKSLTDNPYPREADYFDFWEQGYLQECETNPEKSVTPVS